MRSLAVIAVPVVLTVALVIIACNPASSNGQVCSELTSEIETDVAFDQAEAGTDLSCQTTSDCVVAQSNTACLQSCGAVMNQAGAARLQTALAQINSGVCAQFTSDGCPANPVPTCPTVIPLCVNGACTVPDGGSEDAGVPTSDDAGADAADSGAIAPPADSGASSGDAAADAGDAGADGASDGSADASDAGAGNADGGA